MASPKPFARRVWLNPEGHSSTGSLVAFDGESAWHGKDGEPVRTRFVEVADCHGKVRLHQAENDTLEDYADKIRRMRDTLSAYLEHLDKGQT